MPPYPYTIENGSGEELTFLGVVRDQNGERLDARSLARPGAGPPMNAPEPVQRSHAGSRLSTGAV